MKVIEPLIDSYPRTPIPLSKEWLDLYEETYLKSREGQTWLYKLTQMLEAWMHRKVASNVRTERLLEIGAGTLNHLKYENNVVRYEAIEPFTALWNDQLNRGALSEIYRDIADVPLEDIYDRIISIAVLEHIQNLPFVIARSGLLLKSGGQFNAAIPSEGGFFWGLSWRFTVGISTRIEKGLCYGDLMRHEHISRASEIISLIEYFYDDCEIQRFPFNHSHLSLYTYIHAIKPNLKRCRQHAF